MSKQAAHFLSTMDAQAKQRFYDERIAQLEAENAGLRALLEDAGVKESDLPSDMRDTAVVPEPKDPSL